MILSHVIVLLIFETWRVVVLLLLLDSLPKRLHMRFYLRANILPDLWRGLSELLIFAVDLLLSAYLRLSLLLLFQLFLRLLLLLLLQLLWLLLLLLLYLVLGKRLLQLLWPLRLQIH